MRQVIEVLSREPDAAAARQELQVQYDAVNDLFEDLINGILT